jgi:hypothetical protein
MFLQKPRLETESSLGVGVIQRVRLENFMCHASFIW